MILNTIHLKSCLEGLLELEDNSIDLIMTSPPYPEGMRVYEEKCSAEANEYSNWIEPFLKAARRRP